VRRAGRAVLRKPVRRRKGNPLERSVRSGPGLRLPARHQCFFQSLRHSQPAFHRRICRIWIASCQRELTETTACEMNQQNGWYLGTPETLRQVSCRGLYFMSSCTKALNTEPGVVATGSATQVCSNQKLNTKLSDDPVATAPGSVKFVLFRASLRLFGKLT
jgi:hypothetical protein